MHKRLINGEVWIGMSDEMTFYSLGKPRKVIPIEKTISPKKEKWVYQNRTLLFIDNKLASIQTDLPTSREPTPSY